MWNGYAPTSEILFRLHMFLVIPKDVLCRLLRLPLVLLPCTLAKAELAICLMLLGKFQERLQMDRERCAESAALGKDLAYARDLGHLSNSLKNCGQIEEADKTSIDAFRIAESHYRSMNWNELERANVMVRLEVALVGEVYFGRANILKVLGRYEEEMQLREKALILINEQFGNDDALFSSYGMMLGSSLIRLGEYEQAKPNIEKALEDRRRKLPATHSLINSGEHMLGKLYCLQGALAEAEPLLLGAFKRTRKWNADYYEYASDLAMLRAKQGKPEALKLYEISLSYAEKLFGKENPVILDVLDGYSAALEQFGQGAKSKEMASRAGAIRKRYNIAAVETTRRG